MFEIKMNLAMFYCKVKTQNFEGYVKDPLSTEDIGEQPIDFCQNLITSPTCSSKQHYTKWFI